MFAKRLICWVSAGVVLACSAGLADASELPDSVLVRIEGRRDIVRSFALRRWAQQPAATPSDSITPARVSQFLDLLADEGVITEAAVREAAPWSPADSAEARTLKDRVVMAVALDSVLEAARSQALAPADSADLAGALGVRARAQTVERLKPSYDAPAIERLASAFAALPKPSPDSTLAAQLRVLARRPLLTPGDSSRVLAHSSVGNILAGDIVAAWGRLSIAVRPRIDTSEQVRDMIGNQLFERMLRHAAASGRFDHDPQVTSTMEQYAEQLARTAYLEREVLHGLAADSSAIAAYWTAHSSEWALPRLVRGIRLVLTDLPAAIRMGAALANAAQAESLATRAERGGAHYRFAVSEHSDSALFRRALAAGANTVVGPVADGGNWWIARVTELQPARTRTRAEVYDEVAAQWYSHEAERRVETLAARLRRSTRVESNPAAARQLARELRDSTRPNASASTP